MTKVVDATDTTINPFKVAGTADVVPLPATESVEVIPSSDNPSSNRTEAKDLVPGTLRGDFSLGSQNFRLQGTKSRIVAGANGVASVVFGLQDDGSWGLKVAPTGQDAGKVSENSLVFDSNRVVQQIVSTGTMTLVMGAGGSDYFVTANHNLGFAPTFSAYLAITSGYAQLPYVVLGSLSGIVHASFSATSTPTTFTVACNNFDLTAANYTIKYFLTQTTAN